MLFWKLFKFSLTSLFLAIKNPQIFLPSSKKRAIAISKVLQGLGPAFIKFAQLLSTRPDIVGEKLAKDLRILQDDLPAFSRSNIDKMFLKSYGKLPLEIFEDFDYQAIASASMAQVHKAKRRADGFCAVKILRPNIEEKVKNNAELLYSIMTWLHKKFPNFRRFRLPEVAKLVQRNLSHETDLTFEAANASQMKLNLENDSEVYVPEVYWDLTRRKILVIEWVNYSPLTKIQQYSNITQYQKTQLLRNLVTTFCNQAYRDGVFHADMHPGNIFFDQNMRIVLIDFGIVGRLDKKSKFYITETLRGFLKEDYKSVARIHFEAGYVSRIYNISEFENACRAIGKQMVGKNLSEISVGALFSALLKLTDDFQMATRLELLLIQKATVLLEGVANYIDKNTNIWNLSNDWLREYYMTTGRILKLRFRTFCIRIREIVEDFSS